MILRLFFFNDTAPTEIYTLSLHDALPISQAQQKRPEPRAPLAHSPASRSSGAATATGRGCACDCSGGDRKSTRLNSSHVEISYAVFCLKKKKKRTINTTAEEDK